MSMITSRIRHALGTVRRLVYQTEAEVLSKQRESFLKELKEITEEKKEPDYHERTMAAIASMDGFTTPQILASPMHLVWEYEAKSNEVVNWLGELALNKEEDQDYRAEAVYCLEHTNDPMATDYLIECLNGENFYVSIIALGIITKKLFFKSISNLRRDVEPNKFLEAVELKLEIVKKLKAMEEFKKEDVDSLIQDFKELDMPLTKADITSELARPRREFMQSLVQEHGEPKAKWFLIRIALDDYYEDLDAQLQAFLVLKENNGLEDFINYIRERFSRNYET